MAIAGHKLFILFVPITPSDCRFYALYKCVRARKFAISKHIIMKIAVIVVRILMGLMFLFSSVVVLFKLVPQPELHGTVKVFMDGINAAGYLLPLIKITELICAIAFLLGRFVPLANVVLFPVTVNILFYHSFVDTQGLPIAVLLFLGHLFLAYVYREKYKPMLAAK